MFSCWTGVGKEKPQKNDTTLTLMLILVAQFPGNIVEFIHM